MKFLDRTLRILYGPKHAELWVEALHAGARAYDRHGFPEDGWDALRITIALEAELASLVRESEIGPLRRLIFEISRVGMVPLWIAQKVAPRSEEG